MAGDMNLKECTGFCVRPCCECFDVDVIAEDVVKIYVPWDEGRPVDISKVSFYIDKDAFDKSVSNHSKGA